MGGLRIQEKRLKKHVPNGSQTLTTYLPLKEHAKLKSLAEAEGRSMRMQARILLLAALGEEDNEAKASRK